MGTYIIIFTASTSFLKVLLNIEYNCIAERFQMAAPGNQKHDSTLFKATPLIFN